MRKISLFCLGLLAAMALPGAANTFTVSNTNDTGTGSLRKAVTDANNHAGFDTIAFAITTTNAAGVATITPAGSLPDIISPVIINGYTQPGEIGRAHV